MLPQSNLQRKTFVYSVRAGFPSRHLVSSHVHSSTNLRLLLGHRQVPGVLQELGHVGHDGLLVGVPHVHICIHITIVHDATVATPPSPSESRTRCLRCCCGGRGGRWSLYIYLKQKAEKLVRGCKHAALRESADELTGRAPEKQARVFIKGCKQTGSQ